MEVKIDKQLIDDIIAGKYKKREIQILLAKHLYGSDIEAVSKATNIAKPILYSLNKHSNLQLTLKKSNKLLLQPKNNTKDSNKMLLPQKANEEESNKLILPQNSIVESNNEGSNKMILPPEKKEESNKMILNKGSNKLILDNRKNEEYKIIFNKLQDEKIKKYLYNILLNIYNNININNNSNITDKIYNSSSIENNINILKQLSPVTIKRINDFSAFVDFSPLVKYLLGYYLTYLVALKLNPLIINYEELINSIKQISEMSESARWNDFKTKNLVIKQIDKYFAEHKYVSIVHLKNYIEKATEKERKMYFEEMYQKFWAKMEEKDAEARRILHDLRQLGY